MTQDFIVGLLGLCGAFVNAATRLIAATLGDEFPTPRQVARAWAQFGVALFFGPVAAIVFTPLIVEAWPHAQPAPAAVAVGLAANVLWPVFVEGIVPAFRTALSSWLTSLGAAVGKSGGAEQQ